MSIQDPRAHHLNKKLVNPELPQQMHHLTHHPLLYVNLCVLVINLYRSRHARPL